MRGRSLAGESSLAGGRRRSRRLGVLVFLFGSAIATLFLLVARKRERALAGVEFDRRVQSLAAEISDSFAAPLQGLKFLPAFFEASVEVTRKDFQTFVRTALRETVGVYAFEWLPIVTHSARAEYEENARADGLDGFRFRQIRANGDLEPADQRAVYLPIFYQEPIHQETIGLDLAALPIGEGLLERLRDARGSVASEGIRPQRLPERGTFVAVHRGVFGDTGDGPELKSLVNVLILIKDILDAKRDDGHMEGLHVALVDEGALDGPRALFENGAGSYEAVQKAEWQRQQAIPFADRNWNLYVSPTPTSEVLPGSTPWIVFGWGLGFWAFVGLGVTMASRMRGLRKQVAAALELGQYRLLEKVGAGGMGEVYRARHSMLRRPTAVKLLRAEAADEEGLARFEREVQMTSLLTHPNTVAIYDYGRTPDGVFYYAMEFLEGMSLEAMVKDYGPLPEGRVIHFLLQVCGSLSEAHSAGLIHRDVKPANIMVCRRGGLYDVSKMVDFGLVKNVRSSAEPEVTQAGVVTGTPYYLSPEAIRAADSIDARSDLYAVGAVAYFLVTGKRVFGKGSVIEILGDHLGKAPPAPSERLGRVVTPDLEALILKCLEKKPEARPQSAAELSVGLSQCKDAGTWRQRDAVAWWKERKRPAARPSREAPLPSDAPTLDIDPGAR